MACEPRPRYRPWLGNISRRAPPPVAVAGAVRVVGVSPEAIEADPDRQMAPAKLTLSLRVTGRRHDGFHLLDAEMVTVDLVDELEFSPGDGVELAPGLAAGPLDDTNLVCRALRAARRTARVRLRKRIPAGGGLGGGSADAAAVLRWAGIADTAVA